MAISIEAGQRAYTYRYTACNWKASNIWVSVMKRHTVIALALLLASCATSPNSRLGGDPVPPGKVYSGSYINIVAPQSEGWFLVTSDTSGMAFARSGTKESDSLVASVAMFSLPNHSSAKEFESYVVEEASRDLETGRFTTSDFSHRFTNERGYFCVQVHNVSEDKEAQTGGGSTATLILENVNLYCRHPYRTETGFVATFSHRGHSRYSNLEPEARSFTKGIQVPEQASEIE